jgi:hypothetical protein
MPETIVAVYHRIEDTRAIRRALEEIGTAPDDLHISDYIDPVQANAPASIEKPRGWFYFLSGIPEVDVDAYRRAVARGRTIVAVRVDDERIEPTIAALERFEPMELGEIEVAAAGDVTAAEGAAPTRSGSPSAGGASGRLRRYPIDRAR